MKLNFIPAFLFLICNIIMGQNDLTEVLIESNFNSSYDEKYLKSDLDQLKNFNANVPMAPYAFSRSKYVGSASIVNWDENFGQHRIIGVSYLIGNYDKFKFDSLSGYEKYNEFCSIFFVIPNSEKQLFKSIESKISSRNFPDYYVGQGKLKYDEITIDFVTVISHEETGFIVINEKVFFLNKNNKTLFIYPNFKDEGMKYSFYQTPSITLDNLKKEYSEIINRVIENER